MEPSFYKVGNRRRLQKAIYVSAQKKAPTTCLSNQAAHYRVEAISLTALCEPHRMIVSSIIDSINCRASVVKGNTESKQADCPPCARPGRKLASRTVLEI